MVRAQHRQRRIRGERAIAQRQREPVERRGSAQHGVELAAPPRDRDAERVGAREDHGLGRRRERTEHQGSRGLQDARLLRGDRRDGPPEPIGVLEFDRRDARDRRRDDIRRIEPAAETHLENHAIEPGVGEQQQRRSGRRVEEGRRVRRLLGAQRIDVRPEPGHGGGEPLVLHLDPSDPEAFGPALEMRRREGSDALAGGAEQRLGQQRRRALALRAGDVDDGEAVLGIPESCEETADRLEAEPAVRQVGQALDVDQPLEPGGGIGEGLDRALGGEGIDHGRSIAGGTTVAVGSEGVAGGPCGPPAQDPSPRVTGPCSASTGGSWSPPRWFRRSRGSRT